MPIDFKKLRGEGERNRVTHPRDIFRTLRKKDPDKYKFPRDVQTQIWNSWYGQRQERDQVLKANTGGGKTVVGLLILQSCLNEGVGPAAFISPNNYLADQARAEAEAIGLQCTDDPRGSDYLRGRSILITTIYRLFNGKSIFGVGSQTIPIGSLVLDDAHACLQTVEEQFTVRVSQNHESYSPLQDILLPSIEAISESKAYEIREGYPVAIAEVPFWAWREHRGEVRKHLETLRNDENQQFNWPLIKDDLQNCRCIFGPRGIEVTPRVLPVDLIASYENTRRRIFMSATFADDSVLISHFGVEPSALNRLVVPEAANDVGDRMILVPQAINTELTDGELKAYLAQKSEQFNVVVIVPSYERANAFWQDMADKILDRDTFGEGVDDLRNGHVGLYVFVNRYDGIDLPDDACRILVLDGLPDVRRDVDRIDEAAMQGSSLPRVDAAQRVEQGMGRATRSAEDYAVVILMGSRLVQQLYSAQLAQRFTEVTAAQMELSEQLGQQIQDGGLEALDEAVQSCLDRNDDWVDASRERLVGIRYPATTEIDQVAQARREAFDELRSTGSRDAMKTLIQVTDQVSDRWHKGYLTAEIAAIIDQFDAVEAQELLLRAKKLNRGVMKPADGIAYAKLKPETEGQAARCHKYLSDRFSSRNDLVVSINSVLERLKFEPETSESFEDALHQLGRLLGFVSQRPEKEYGSGPDVLWGLGGMSFAVIEAKNGAIVDTIKRDYCNQIGGSVRWFKERYDAECEPIPVMIHPSRQLDDAATSVDGLRIIDQEKLSGLVTAARTFLTAVAGRASFGTPEGIGKLLNQHGLNQSAIFDQHAAAVRR
ncbi:MAG: helicase C-terminal domain-containing protein [Planctomycetota bacterium]